MTTVTTETLRRVACVACLSLTLVTRTYAQDPCGNFEEGWISEGKLETDYGGAVLRLQVAGTTLQGTGYLIEATQGFILTAAHVVDGGPKATIDVTSPALPGRTLKATLVKRATGSIDLALLKLTNPSDLPRVQAIDIALRFPAKGDRLYAMSYPKLGDEPNFILRGQTVELMAATGDWSIEVKQTASLGGASGGPLFNSAGSAVGTASQKVGVGASMTRYLPMVLSKTLLDEIPIPAWINALDEKLKVGAINRETLVELMKKRPGNPTNLELYSWVRKITAHRADYAGVANLIQCPIITALSHRKMEELIIPLTMFASAKQLGDANYQLSMREAAIGQGVLAVIHARDAVTAYQAASDTQGELSAKLLMARAQLDTGATKLAELSIADVMQRLGSLPPAKVGGVYSVAAKIDVKKGAFPAAMTKYSKASDVFRTSGNFSAAGDSTFSIADIYTQMGNWRSAQHTFRKAIDLYEMGNDETGKANALYGLARTQAAAGGAPDAVVTFQKYLELAPNGPHSREARIIVDLRK